MGARGDLAHSDPGSSNYENAEPEPLYGEEEDRILGIRFCHLCQFWSQKAK